MPDSLEIRTPIQKVIVFGGTFDPPHIGHVQLPELVRQKLNFDAIFYIPTAQSPHKQDQIQTPMWTRFRLVQAAVQDNDFAVATDVDFRRPPPSYTVDTLELLAQEMGPDAQMRLLIGADQARVFDKWHQSERIIELAEPIVMVRPPDTIESLTRDLGPKWAQRLIELPAIDVSATQIRQRVANGESIDELVTPPVKQAIESFGLYTH